MRGVGWGGRGSSPALAEFEFRVQLSFYARAVLALRALPPSLTRVLFRRLAGFVGPACRQQKGSDDGSLVLGRAGDWVLWGLWGTMPIPSPCSHPGGWGPLFSPSCSKLSLLARLPRPPFFPRQTLPLRELMTQADDAAGAVQAAVGVITSVLMVGAHSLVSASSRLQAISAVWTLIEQVPGAMRLHAALWGERERKRERVRWSLPVLLIRHATRHSHVPFPFSPSFSSLVPPFLHLITREASASLEADPSSPDTLPPPPLVPLELGGGVNPPSRAFSSLQMVVDAVAMGPRRGPFARNKALEEALYRVLVPGGALRVMNAWASMRGGEVAAVQASEEGKGEGAR